MLKKRIQLMLIAFAIIAGVAVGTNSPALAQNTVNFFGLPNTELGNAFIDTMDIMLLVSNIGPSGADGVAIDLGAAEFGTVTLNGFDPAVKPFGSFRKTTAIGEVDGVPGLALGFLLEIARGDTTNLKCGFATALDLGILTVELYESVHGDPHVYEGVDFSQAFAQVFGPGGYITVTPILVPRLTDSGGSEIIPRLEITYEIPCPVSVASNPVVMAKKLVIKGNTNVGDPVYIRKTTVTGKSFGNFRIAGEGLGMFGNLHTVLGTAHFSGGDVGPALIMAIDNIGSTGDDGVRIEWFPLPLPWDLDPPSPVEVSLEWDTSLANPVAGSAITLSAVGAPGGQTGEPLGYIRCNKKAAPLYEIFSDTTEFPESDITVWNGDELILEITGHSGVAALADECPSGGAVGTNFFCFVWKAPAGIDISGHPPIFGTKLMIKPVGAPTADYIEYVDIKLKDLDEFVITDEIVSYEWDVLPGDVNGDGMINVSDAVALIAYIFGGGPPPDPLEAGDCNCDGTVNITDVVMLLNYIFGGGPEPGCKGSAAKLDSGLSDAEAVIRVRELTGDVYKHQRFEIEIENSADIAALQLKFAVDGDAAWIGPHLKERAEGLEKFYWVESDTLTVGVIDLDAVARIAAGEGVVLSIAVLDCTELVLELVDAIVVDEHAREMRVTLAKSESAAALPTEFQLEQNYPNPCNPTTTIRFSLARAAEVRLDIFNVLGQKVKTLVDEYRAAGHHGVSWDGRDDNGQQVASGVYLYRLATDGFSDTRKMMLLK